MPKIKKKIVKMDEKTRIVMQCFLNALHSNSLKNYKFAEKTKTNGLGTILKLMLPKGLEGDFIGDAFDATEYELPEVSFQMDYAAEILYKSYLNFWHNLLKQNGINKDKIVGETTSNHNLLIYELLRRMCADAFCVNMSIENHDGEILLKTMQTFIDNLKAKRKIVLNEKIIVPDKLSGIALFLGTSHEVWMTWMSDMVDSVKTIHANLQTIVNMNFHLEKTKIFLQSLLLAELATHRDVKKLKAYHFDEEIIEITLRELEDQCIKLAGGKKPQNSKKLAKAENIKIMSSSVTESTSLVLPASTNKDGSVSSQDVIRALEKSSEKSTLIDSSCESITKSAQVSHLYDLLAETKTLLSVVACMRILDSTMGWIAVMTKAINLDSIAELFNGYLDKCSKLTVSEAADIFKKNTDISLALLTNDSTSGIRLAKAGKVISAQLQWLQNPIMLEQVLGYSRGAIVWLADIQSRLPSGLKLIDETVCQKLFGALWSATQDKPNGNSPSSVEHVKKKRRKKKSSKKHESKPKLTSSPSIAPVSLNALIHRTLKQSIQYLPKLHEKTPPDKPGKQKQITLSPEPTNPFEEFGDEDMVAPVVLTGPIVESVSSGALPVPEMKLPIIAEGKEEYANEKTLQVAQIFSEFEKQGQPLFASLNQESLNDLWDNYRATKKISREAKKAFIGIFSPTKVDVSLILFNKATQCTTDAERAQKINRYMLSKNNWHLGFCEFLWKHLQSEQKENKIESPGL